MRYRHLGASGLRVSVVSLGSWLTFGGYVQEQAAIDCIHRAFELGINLFDTANVYGQGHAERVVGRALQGIDRDDYVLATKVYWPMGEGPNDRGLSRKHVMEQCERSLQRLGVDYLDLYQCHRPDPETPMEETMRAFDDLVTQGKVLYPGVSEFSADQLREARAIQDRLALDPLISNQPQYSMLFRAIERDVIPVSRELGIGQIVWSPLAQGVLTGKYRPGDQPPPDSRAAQPEEGRFMRAFMRDEVLKVVQGLRPIADGLGVTMAQLAIAWVLREDNVASAIVGASRPEQVDDNAAASEIELSDDVLGAIDEALAGAFLE
jgi:voltage-dependent potassium channel beta subunit